MFDDQKTTKNEDLIEELLTRSVEKIFPDKESLKRVLVAGKKTTFYYGIDPTGPTIHAGHMVPILVMKRLQDLGHKIIFLIGDFTAMIGDPSDKTATRRTLTKKEVTQNLKNYKKQASRLIRFSGSNKAEIKFNSKWLSKMSFRDVVDLASKVTVDQMLKRDMFEKRSNEGKPIYLHEFLYPLMQGYDSVALNVDGEVGGNDQTFNMLVGRDMLKTYKNREKFVITTKILTDAGGKKMGKTDGNMVSLSDTSENVFGKIMSWPDEMIISSMECLTLIPTNEIKESEQKIKNGGNPRDEKIKLAEAVTNLCFGLGAGEKAKDKFVKTFTEKNTPDDVPEIDQTTKGTLNTLIDQKIIESKSEIKRLADAGAITDTKTGEKISFEKLKNLKNVTLKIGKHRFVKIK